MAWLDVTPTDYRNYAAPSRPRSVFGQLSFVDGLVDLGLQLLFFAVKSAFHRTYCKHSKYRRTAKNQLTDTTGNCSNHPRLCSTTKRKGGQQ